MENKIFEFNMDSEMIEKLKFIADEQNISIDDQIIIPIQKAIREFEENHGSKRINPKPILNGFGFKYIILHDAEHHAEWGFQRDSIPLAGFQRAAPFGVNPSRTCKSVPERCPRRWRWVPWT